MAPRLGNVIYWIACNLAVLIIVWPVVALIVSPPGFEDAQSATIAITVILGLFWGIAAGIWLVGRAIKYLLSGS